MTKKKNCNLVIPSSSSRSLFASLRASEHFSPSQDSSSVKERNSFLLWFYNIWQNKYKNWVFEKLVKVLKSRRGRKAKKNIRINKEKKKMKKGLQDYSYFREKCLDALNEAKSDLAYSYEILHTLYS